MATGWNGSGTVVLTDGTYNSTWAANWAGDADATIKTGEFDLLMQCIEDSIQNCLPHDGQKAASSDIPMGSNKITGLGASSANTDAASHGKDVASGAYSSPNVTLTLNDSTTIDIDVSGLEAGTGGVDLTSAQTAAGIKTWSAIGSHAHAKFNGPTTSKVLVPTPGANVTINATGANVHYVTVGTNTDVTFTWPTGASDTQLGDNWSVSGRILFHHTGAGYSITLNSTMLAALDYYEEEGAEATGSGDLSTLVYTYTYINGTTLGQFAWVATP